MLEGNILLCIWRQNEANKIMEFNDAEPAYFPKNRILSKAKQKREKINLALTTSDPLIIYKVQPTRRTNTCDWIRSILYALLEQAAIFVQNSEYICIDGTGSIVKKLKNYQSNYHPIFTYLYQIIIKTDILHACVSNVECISKYEHYSFLINRNHKNWHENTNKISHCQNK